MSEEVLADDQSHYEVSLTAGQAFLAFVLLLLSLAASFAFGLLLGRGQGDGPLLRKQESASVVNETTSVPSAAKSSPREVAVKDDDFKQAPPATVTEEKQVAPAAPAVALPQTQAKAPVHQAVTAPPVDKQVARPAEKDVPHFAQLLSTSDQKTAEALAAKLIDAGFTSSYVERNPTDKGIVYRVRTRFPSEAEARAAEGKLKTFSKDVWITKQ